MAVIPVGTEFQVNTFTTRSQENPAVAMDGDGDFVITWEGYYLVRNVYQYGIGYEDIASTAIFAQRYNADNTPNGSEFQVSPSAFESEPSVAVDMNGDFIITWTNFRGRLGRGVQTSDVFVQRYNVDGSKDGSEFQVNSNGLANEDSSVAVDMNGDFIITWTDGLFSDSAFSFVNAQRYNADGTTNGSKFFVTQNKGAESDSSVAVDMNGDFVITWTGSPGINYYDYNGNPYTFVPDGDQSGIFAQRYNADGTTNGGEFLVNTFTTSNQSESALAVDGDGDFIITWTSDEQDGDGDGIFAQRYNTDGTKDGSEFQVNTFTTSSQRDSSVAVDGDGNFIITWTSSSQDGSGDGIFAQYYNADGTKNGTEFQVNTFTTGSQNDPAVAADGNGSFIITWTSSSQDGDDSGVFAQRFEALAPLIYQVNGTPIAKPVESYGGPNQDVTGTAEISPSNQLNLSGNLWRKIEVNSTINSNTFLRFEFAGNGEGEVQGIGFDNNNVIAGEDRGQFFQVDGSQSWGIEDLDQYIVGNSGDKDIYEIPVGQFFTGDFDFLTIANDDDQPNPNAEAQFSNIEIFELLDISINGVTESEEVLSYGGANQNPSIISTVSNNNELQLEGNGWKRLDITGYEVSENTFLKFEFAGNGEGEIQGIGFDNNNIIAGEDRGQFFQVDGSQSWGVENLDQYIIGNSGDKDIYKIPVGQFFTGDFDFLTIANDHDISNPTAVGQFQNIQLIG